MKMILPDGMVVEAEDELSAIRLPMCWPRR